MSIIKHNAGGGELQLSPIQIKEEYRKKWNESSRDFVVLTVNGELISDSYYRVGGMGSKPDGKNYFMLLKYVEAYYPEWITKHTGSDPKHLSGRWCILDKDGFEKIVFDDSKSPYLVKDSCIYSLDGKYYNIENGECYGYSNGSIRGSEFLFIDNQYSDNPLKKGVMKVNKKDGTWEVFP